MNIAGPAFPSIPRAAGLAWGDTGRAFAALPVPALIALVVVAALTVGQDLMAAPAWAQRLGVPPLLLAVVFTVLQSLLLTPYLIALQRFVAHGESTWAYPLTPAARVWRYFGWLLAISALVLLPLWLTPLMTSDEYAALAIFAAFVIVAIFISLRVMLLLPALALDSPGARFANAWADCSGHAWRAFFVFLLALIPWVGIVFFVAMAAIRVGAISLAPMTFGPAIIANSLVQAAIVLVGYTLIFAIASRLYEWFGQRLKPAPIAAPAKGKRDRPRKKKR